MFGCGHRTPAKAGQSERIPNNNNKPDPPKGDSVVRETTREQREIVVKSRPVEREETARAGPSQIRVVKAGQSQTRDALTVSATATVHTAAMPSQGSGAAIQREKPLVNSPLRIKGRVTEAKACLIKTKLQLNNSRNLKAEIKSEVLLAVERLYQLVKEAEAEGSQKEKLSKVQNQEEVSYQSPVQKKGREEEDIIKAIEAHSQLIIQNNAAMKLLNGAIERQSEVLEKTSYAEAAAGAPKQLHLGQAALHPIAISSKNAVEGSKDRANERKTLHSIAVTSEDDQETGEEVLHKIRKAVEAKEGWIRVEKVRKAKDRKIILGCSTREDREKIKKKIQTAGQRLVVEDMRNKDPLLVLKDVLSMHSDEEVIRALRNQNREVFHALDDEENRMTIKYRKKTRNPHTGHIVMTVSPTIWGRATEQGRLRIDLQNVFVEDQSPLVQCSKCLGYGHGRRFCKAPADLCSHCGGPHLGADCPDRVIGEAPICINCKRASSENTNHNAFNKECPVRKKWDSIARASIQYCC